MLWLLSVWSAFLDLGLYTIFMLIAHKSTRSENPTLYNCSFCNFLRTGCCYLPENRMLLSFWEPDPENRMLLSSWEPDVVIFVRTGCYYLSENRMLLSPWEPDVVTLLIFYSNPGIRYLAHYLPSDTIWKFTKVLTEPFYCIILLHNTYFWVTDISSVLSNVHGIRCWIRNRERCERVLFPSKLPHTRSEQQAACLGVVFWNVTPT